MTAIATDGACELSWDDSIVTSMTPTPSARCPFEAFHEYDISGEPIPLWVDEIPKDWPVQPIAAGGLTLETDELGSGANL